MGITAASTPVAALPRAVGDDFVLEDESLRVRIDRRGVLASVRDLAADREMLPEGKAGAVLQLFRDTPREWDAWDINEEDQRSGRELLEPVSVGVEGDSVAVRHAVGGSTVEVRFQIGR